MKFMKTVISGVFCMLFVSLQTIAAQEVITDKAPEVAVLEKKQENDSVKVVNFKKIKVDGVAAVVGDYVILESDIDKNLIDLQNQGVLNKDITRCQLLGKLMEDKLYAHHAVQDSLEISETEIKSVVGEQINYLVQQLGTMEKLLEYYNKDDEESFRSELFEIQKTRRLSERMQATIIESIEITPEEVRQWFKKIPKDQLPRFGAELEIAQIIKEPKASKEEIEKIVDKLRTMKQDVEENGASFATKAVLYSDDEASRPKGGFYAINRKTPFLKEFKDVAFSLQEGEVSDPFKTIYGWHIILVEKIRGQEIDLRHILLTPKVSDEAVEEAKEELEKIRKRIIDKELTFEEAAKNFSDEKETKFDGGVLRNPTNFDTRFELTKMDPTLYNQVRDLKDNEISTPLLEEGQNGTVKYKILKVTNRYDEHDADYSQDYLKIKQLALSDKQLKAIQKWMKEKIADTYINVGSDNKSCEFNNNWLKK
ncbi:peptidylprolyl isomerase [Ascidiimonas sp. W6]|uniref:peptidylprolyl isomerase n=1 Tax=Ascidiimonas meishanensis TaxID=3128903 RepID=UPI0030EE8500